MTTRTSSQMHMFADDAQRPAEDGGAVRSCQTRGLRGSRGSREPAEPPLQVCVLGSGSGGNSTVLRWGSDAILLDAGFGPRTTFKRLGMAKVGLDDLKAVVLTHLDRDHFRPNWLKLLADEGIGLYVHRWHLKDLERVGDVDPLRRADLLRPFGEAPFDVPLRSARMTPVQLPHDTKGTVGFRVQTPAGSVGYATDLGHVPTALIDCFAGVDLLAIESNYDPHMQQASSRPVFLKRRIMGMAGHLSNEAVFAAVQRVVDKSPIGSPQHVVLLHGSRQCNHENIIRRVFAQDPRLKDRITLTHQRRRTRWLTVRPLQPMAHGQMRLGF